MDFRGVAVWMVLAAAVTPWLPGSPLWWALLWIPAGVLAFRLRHPVWVLFPCLLLCGLRTVPGPRDAVRILPPRAQTVQARVRVVGDARRVEFRSGETRIRLPVRLQALQIQQEWAPVTGRVQLRCGPDAGTIPHPGVELDLTGVLSPADLPFVGLRRAGWMLEVESLESSGDRSASGTDLQAGLFAFREQLSRRITFLTPDHPAERSVLLALLLGMRNEVDDQRMNGFARSGLIHLFAISGLHLGMLAGMLAFGGRWAGLSYRWQALWVLPLLFAFAWMTGMRASAVRALVMISVFLLARMVYRRPQALVALSFSVVVILALAPEQIRDPGFQFSVILVGGLLTLGREFDAWLQRMAARDPWAPVTKTLRFWDHKIKIPVLRLLGVSCVCSLLSAPLTATYFNLFSPVGVIGNLMAVPLVFLLLAGGFLTLPFLAFPEALAAAVFQIPVRLAGLLLIWVEQLNSVPYGVQFVRSPPLWSLAAGAAVLLAWVRGGRWRTRGVWVGLVLAGFLSTEAWLHFRSVEVVVVDAERGQAGWLRNARREIVVVDTGSDWSGWRLAQTLREEGIDHIAAVVLTHPDPHHTGGLPHLLEHWQPDHILVPSPDADHPHFTKFTGTLPVVPLHREDRMDLAGWRIHVLHPGEDESSRSTDDRSLVLRFVDRTSSVLWMGGASEGVESVLLESGLELSAGVVVAGHHRSRPGMHLPFLQAVGPRLVVMAGQGFGGITASRETTEQRVRESGVPILTPEETGKIRIHPVTDTWLP